jgi:hypothetical protein
MTLGLDQKRKNITMLARAETVKKTFRIIYRKRWGLF